MTVCAKSLESIRWFGCVILSPGHGLVKKEEVQGLGRAALAGGIPCLLAAKWNISCEERTALMTRVLTSMAANGVGQSNVGIQRVWT